LKKRLLLVKFQIKESIKTAPKVTAVMVITVAAVIIAAYILMYVSQGADTGKLKTALVVNDTNIYVDAAIDYLSQDEKVAELCEFIRTDEQTAMTNLADGAVQAVVLIPEGFFDGIMNGKNISPKVILKKAGQISGLAYFQEMISAGARSLAIAQAAIYAADDICRRFAPDKYNETQDYLNRILFVTVLRREILFNTELVSETAGVTTVNFYIAGAVMAIILVSMSACCNLFSVSDKKRIWILHMNGINCVEDVFFRYIGNTLFYFAAGSVLYLAAGAVSGLQLSPAGFGRLLVFMSALTAFMIFFSSFSSSRSASSFVCICAVLVLLVLSGNIVPLSLMPAWVGRLGKNLPLRYYTFVLAKDNSMIAGSLLWSIAFLSAAAVTCKIKNKMDKIG
jgi:ABC-2 type transport system permease protein